MLETWVRSLGREDPLEKEMATHSSILAWRIPWREEPGGLQSMGSQRVRHDWATSLTHSLITEKIILSFYIKHDMTSTPWTQCLQTSLTVLNYELAHHLEKKTNVIFLHARNMTLKMEYYLTCLGLSSLVLRWGLKFILPRHVVWLQGINMINIIVVLEIISVFVLIVIINPNSTSLWIENLA